jgi:hypothetical protein
VLNWIDESVGLGQALDPNTTDDPAKVTLYTSKWGVPTPYVAPQFNGSFWFWELAPQGDWVPQFGEATSLRGAQALAVWNAHKQSILYGPYIRNPPYVFQAGLAPSPPAPAPSPTPTPQPAPTSAPSPAVAKAATSDFWKPTLTIGAIIAGIAALAWYAT